jgi:hypothetical protein
MWDGFAAPENDPVFTRRTRSGGAGASRRSPETAGFSNGGVVTQSSLLPIEPSASTWLDGTVWIPSCSTPAHRSPFPYQETLRGCPGGRFPFGSVTGQPPVDSSRRSVCER